MIPLRLQDISRVTGGRLVGGAGPDDCVDGPVVLDSRAVAAGSLFVAVRGEYADGHDYAQAAVEAGAVGYLGSRDVGVPGVVVDDAAVALGALAGAVLRRLPATRVVGVTGSAGKTSTKDLLGAVFATAGPTVAPPGNLNNEYGLPLTVTTAQPDTETVVLEYGARGVGHIRYLTTIAPPRIGVVLNVGAAHLGEFGSKEMVAQAKGELVEALPADGTAVLNADDPLVAAMASRTAASVLTYGTAESAAVRIVDLTTDEAARARFTLSTPKGDAAVALSLHGAHHAHNAAAAVAAGLAAGLDLASMVGAVEGATARSPHRMDVRTRADGVVVIDDAYNASPDSMLAGLRALVRMQATGRRWAVLGAMRELGAETESAHRDIGVEAARLGVDRLVVVGPDAAPIADGWPGEVSVVDDADSAAALVAAELHGGDVVLVKASNSERLWRVADRLVEA
ncbi:MAG: UDP-N-acetylmuramoyl-tripeptide--D-alanyl-D-alanine ligase [Frankiaceae bacterium]|jgi:UDP-N-acetylmuramoyl-tripeptide--D-alanyl-D-alanine ligase|nr:UDP-N-acetylmuramoyl-tripeptide--D-alanyl-D-alanine ligase [Frankiaceae bacterium]